MGALRVDFGSPGADFWSPGTYLELFGGHFVAIWVPLWHQLGAKRLPESKVAIPAAPF